MNDPKQLLGIKGASETSSIWKLRIQLMKPITWIPLIWGVICGAAASGNFEWTFSNVLASLACMLMSGPLSMYVNEWTTSGRLYTNHK